jgi:hypothetical protein
MAIPSEDHRNSHPETARCRLGGRTIALSDLQQHYQCENDKRSDDQRQQRELMREKNNCDAQSYNPDDDCLQLLHVVMSGPHLHPLAHLKWAFGLAAEGAVGKMLGSNQRLPLHHQLSNAMISPQARHILPPC